MMLVAGAAMACGLAACSDDDTTPSGNITPADQLYLPRNNATIMLETGNTTHGRFPKQARTAISPTNCCSIM